MLKLTLRGLFTHKVRLISTVIAVVLGVGFMVGTQVLGATVTKSFDEAFADIYADIDVVARSSEKIETPFGDQRGFIDGEIVDTVAGVEGVAAAEGVVEANLTVVGPDGEPLYNDQAGPPTFALSWETSPELNGWEIVEGAPPAGPDEVAIDAKMAEDGPYAVGDPIELAVSQGTVTKTVVGIASFGSIDNYGGAPAVLFETATAQELVGEPGRFSRIDAAGADDIGQEALANRIARDVPVGTEVLTGAAFTEENQDVFRDFIAIFTNFITAFGVIALFVGAFIIYNTFTILVTQRTRELALLRAIGAGRGQVVRSVLVEATVVGIIASLLGVAFGILVGAGLKALLDAVGFALPGTPLQVRPLSFVFPVALALAVTLFSAVFPAWRASRIAPVAAMREVDVDRSHRSVVRLGLGALVLVLSIAATVQGLQIEGDDTAALIRVGGGLLGVFLANVMLGPLYVKPLARLLSVPLRWLGIAGRIGGQNAERSPNRSATTEAALAIPVGLVAVITIAAASLTATSNRIIDDAILGDYVVSAESFLGFSPQLAADLNDVDGVQTAAGLRFGAAEIAGDGRFLLAIDPATFPQILDLDVSEGSIAELGRTGIAVSTSRAAEEGWTLGQDVMVRFSETGEQPFQIVALFGGEALGGGPGGGFLISQEAFDANFPPNLQFDQQVFVLLDDGVDPVSVRPALDEVVAGYPTATLQDLTEVKEEQAAQINQFLSVIYVLLFLSVIVGVIGITNTLLLSVYERTHELGLLRAVGATRWQIRNAVGLEAVLIALMGAVSGIVIGFVYGLALVRALAGDTETVFSVPPASLIAIGVVAGVLGVVSSLAPAWRAGRLNVLEAIAQE
ncbi:MAG: FtsX-like permease family protein [Acidimicrobiales bacterium]|jgi:putative ABC transport system permease protein|nr:FtsX-like permease family protein [Acidimicrobiales bacterium]